jgi:O-antigen/teichoic acid export membrane protein
MRGLSLIGKLALSLYMAKFFPLAELGRYGLAFGAVMLAIVLFGFRLDYILSREVLALARQDSRRIGTTVMWVFIISFIAGAPIALWSLRAFGDGTSTTRFLLLVYLICCVEAYANFLYTATIALNRPLLANGLFFIRSGLWTIPAMGLSYLHPAFRDVGFVLSCWLVGVSCSVLLNCWLTRERLCGWFPWRQLAWNEVQGYVRKALLVWIGSVGLTLGAYIDRFVLARYMELSDVGIATFYLSFTTSVSALVQSATIGVTFPALIEHYDRGDEQLYNRELRKSGVAAAVVGGTILIPLAAGMPMIIRLLGKPALIASYPAFVLLLVATWIRVNAETVYYALFVHRQHRAIWLGNLLFLVVVFCLNLTLIPRLGLTGLGCAALLAASGLLAWRGVCVVRHKRTPS